MAGNYPDPISNRMAYDRDGTQLYVISGSNGITALTAAQTQEINDEDDQTSDWHIPDAMAYLLLFFPEKRDISGWLAIVSDQSAQPLLRMDVSTNTTNGLDGTWTTVASNTACKSTPVKPTFRTGVNAVSALGQQAVRFATSPAAGGGNLWLHLAALHLYGNISPGQNPDRLALWHPTNDAHVSGAYFDWGDVPRSSSADRTFRVKNLSPTKTAQTIQLTLDAMSDATPSVPGQYTLSSDGVTFTANLSIPDLPPGGVSNVLTVRRVTPSNAQLSLWNLRLIAQAAAWS